MIAQCSASEFERRNHLGDPLRSLNSFFESKKRQWRRSKLPMEWKWLLSLDDTRVHLLGPSYAV